MNTKLGAAYRFIGRQFGRFTEFSDALKCVYASLPEDVKKHAAAQRHGKSPSMKGKLQLVYKHFNSLDIESMVDCLAKNHLEDAAIGKMSKYHADARKKFGVRGGYLSRLSKLPEVNIRFPGT